MESTEDTDAVTPSSQSVRLVLPSEEQRIAESKQCVNLWKRALQKLQSVDLDPWLDFQLGDTPARTAIRHRYSAIKKKWVVDEICVRLEITPFDRGAMRECFRLKKLSHSSAHANDWQHASNYVAKRYINKVDKQVYFDDVRLQMEAKLWGEAFNRQNPPKKVDIFQLSVIELRPPLDASSKEARDSDTGVEFYHIERFMEGEYRKYNSNSGFVDEQLRNTPQAFSHFTFERSGHRLLVVDIQGVGDLYTDPQIHTSDGVGYSDGNLGPRGMAYFFHSHRCNPLCEYLALTPFDLAPSELRDPSLPHFIPNNPPNDSGASDQASPTDCCCDSPSDPLEVESHVTVKNGNKAVLNKFKSLGSAFRRRSVSFSQSSETFRFGPTIARSAENVRNSLPPGGPRRRGDSISVFSDAQASDLSDDLVNIKPNYQELNLVAKPCGSFFVNHGATEIHALVKPRGQFNTDICLNPVRGRFASGDSGYSGRSNFRTLYEAHVYGHSLATDPVEYALNISASSLTNSSLPTSPSPLESSLVRAPLRASSGAEDEFDHPTFSAHQNPVDWLLTNPSRNTGWPLMPRRSRNLSESSDLDVEEDRRNAGNLLHQLMHETQRPSCAAHPTNLDQEIGQSVLGQIHHELARLHEAGRFLPTSKGGWSHAGLGGLLLREAGSDIHSDEQDQSELSSPSQTIDWEAVLFHEGHAAQLGCLEAMIVMAHYYLGLPTQLLLDCPIKPAESDLRFGLDYLWRAAEGGDRRCMILLARYLDVSATLSESPDRPSPVLPNPREFLFLPMLHTMSMDALPSVSPDSWAEAVTWYQKAVDAACTVPNGHVDEGLDAEGGYDAAEDLLPLYRILARMAEMYAVGGFGLKQDLNRVGDLYNRAGELALAAFQGRLATNYFDLSEEAYAQVQ